MNTLTAATVMQMDRSQWLAESTLKRLTDKFKAAKNPLKRHRYHMRIKRAEVRLLALKLSRP